MHSALDSSGISVGIRTRQGLLALAGALLLVLVWASVAQAASYTVNVTSDDNTACTPSPSTSSCSLRGAITAANATSDDDTITVPAGTYPLTIAGSAEDGNATGDLDIGNNEAASGSLTIQGAGSGSTTIDANGLGSRVDGLGDRAIQVIAGPAMISGLTVTNGTADGPGGGILSTGSTTLDGVVVTNSTALTDGGGIEVASGTLTVTRSTVSGNKAILATNGTGGGIDVPGGSTLNLFDSTVSENTSADNAGGLRVEGTATAERDTFTGNTAMAGFAGGIGVTSSREEFNTGTGTLTLKNSTVTGNTAAIEGGGLGGFGNATVVSATIASNTASTGANVTAGGTTTLQNTIVADPIAPISTVPIGSLALAAGGTTNCTTNSGGTLTSRGYNLEDDAGDSTTSTPPTCNFTQSTDKSGVDPKLGPLADNGGPTKTRALLVGSPAVDQGTGEGLTVNMAGRVTDQRGVLRPVGPQADIGAFELAPPTAVTGAAADITQTGATVTGTATNPALTAGQAFFEYGPVSDPTGTKTASQPVAAGASGVAVSAQLTGLERSTTYHYRLVVTNGEGTSTGEDKTFTTLADTANPTVTIVTPADGATYRQDQVVNADFSCADEAGGSGLKSCVGTVANGSRVDTSTLGSHTFTATATDNAGNTATKTVTYTVVARPDTTDPTVKIVTPADGAFYRQGQVIKADYSCADEAGGSGIKSCVGTVANGSPIDTKNADATAAGARARISASSAGRHSFTVTATDNAGNTASRTVYYTVVAEAAPRAADLALSMRARPARVRIGAQIAYTLTLTNKGPDRATGVVVRDRLPGGVRFASVHASHGGSCTGGRTVVCRFSSLRLGARVQVVITVHAVRTGRTRNAARVSGTLRDPRGANDVAAATAVIVARPRPRPRPRFTG